MTATSSARRVRLARRLLGWTMLTLLLAFVLSPQGWAAGAPQATWIEDETWGPWMQFYGRLHFALVHFPVGLLIAAGIIELCRIGRMGPRPCNATMVCLTLGWLSAALAAYSGWTYAAVERHGHPADGLMYWHRWGGVAVAGAAFLTWTLGWAGRSGKRSWARTGFSFLLLLTTVGTGVVGHLGGSLVYGEDYLTEPFTDEVKARRIQHIQRSQQKAIEEPADDPQAEAGDGVADPSTLIASGDAGEGGAATTTGTDPGAEETTDATSDDPAAGDVEPAAGDGDAVVAALVDEAEAYAVVEPILDLTCYHCHGARKGKGDLRLHEVDQIFEGEPTEWVVVPGHPDKSELLRRISLPGDHDDVMPSDDDPLSADEIEAVRAWIAAMDPEVRGLPADGGTAGSAVLGDWAEAVGSETSGDDAGTDPEGTGDTASAEPEATAGDEGTGEATAVVDEGALRREGALAALVERGAIATRVAEDTEDVDVVFGLLRDGVTDADLALLAGLEPVLVSLDLSRTAVTDAGLAALADFTSLERLRLEQTGIGDAALAHLRGMERLEYLNLYGTQVTDEGLGELAGASALRKLYLWQTPVTAAGVEALRTALPALEIVRDVELPAPPPPLVVVEGETTFEAHAGPILAAKCVSCHGPESPAAGIRLDSFDAMFAGTWAEWVVKPGDTELSRLLVAVRKPAGEKGAMPKKGDPLTEEELATLVAWVGGLTEEEAPEEAPETGGE